jgi:tellurite resistance protein TehA-like permease
MSCERFSHTFKSTFNLYASFRITKHEHSYQKMTSVWLLPVITLIVASSVGGELAQALHPHSVTCALTTIAFTIFILSIGLALALMILTIYLTRLVLHGFPQGLSIVSSFMPLGPCGQAGFSVLLIGQFMKETLPVAGSRSPFLGSAQAGEVVFALCVCISFMLWAFATMWLVYALLGIQHIIRRTRISFQLAFWGMIFPNVSRMIFSLLVHVTVSIHRACTQSTPSLCTKSSMWDFSASGAQYILVSPSCCGLTFSIGQLRPFPMGRFLRHHV